MKNKMLKLAAALVIPAVLPFMTSCSTESNSQSESMTPVAEKPSPSMDGGRGGIMLNAVTGTATVQSINAADRTVVLAHPDGTTTSYECGPEVRNFDQIKVGDVVTATAAEEMAIVVVPGGTAPAAGTASAIVRAPLGAKPGGKVVNTVGFTANVVSVNKDTRKVTLHMADGTDKTVTVGPDVNLDNVKVGDAVGVRITRAFAISVTAPGSTPSKQ